MYDIIIVGGGPSGSTLARLIGTKYKVLLLDKRNLDKEYNYNEINKCCGGLLAPDAQKMLAELGMGIPKSILVDPQLFVVRTIDLENSIERNYQRFYFNLDREKFDRWLVSQIPDNVDLGFECKLKSFNKTDGGYNVKFTQNGKEYNQETKVIIGADGANSSVKRLLFPECKFPQKYVSIQEWYEMDKNLPYFSAIFDSEITDFYSWTIPKEQYLLLGSALIPDSDANEKFELLKNKLREYGFYFGKQIKREGSMILRPENVKKLSTGKDNVALIGEAAGWISPSSAEGFSYGLKSAKIMAESLDKGIEGFLFRYKMNTSGLRRNIRLKLLKSPFMYNSKIRNLIMKSGIQSI